VRAFRRVVLIAAGIGVAAALLLLVNFEEMRPPAPLSAPQKGEDLVVLVRPGPVVYFPGIDGNIEGLDADLARLYAAQRKMTLRFVAIDTAAELLSALGSGEAHIGMGGMLRPLADAKPRAASAAAIPPADGVSVAAPDVAWTSGYYTVESLLIYNTDGFKPANWDDLEGATVAYLDASDHEPEIDAVRSVHPAVRWAPLALPSPVSLVARVSEGMPSYAIVGSLAAAIARNIYLDFEVAFPVGGRRQLAWAVPGRFPELRADVERFFERVKRDGTLDRLTERYLPDSRQFQRLDASGLLERMRTVLPQYRTLFHDTQEKTGIEWRLLAALAYQESKWDASATSETGVRGFMQITEDTARHLGVKDLLDPAQNVLAAGRYLRDLKEKMPLRIQEPDRTWLALAAYNIGLGHLEDARVLAQRLGLNPDHWKDVKKVLPLLALPEHYEKAKLGFARGGMPVAFVDRVRGYYDVLLAHQPPLQPRLRLFADTPMPELRSDPPPAKN
jgi:membrane-bound lytic murein transglycosylase F